MAQPEAQRIGGSLDAAISFPAPALCQMDDEDAVLTIGEAVFPGFVARQQHVNGLRLWVMAEPSDPTAREVAARQFRVVLGLLRALRPASGELRDEWLNGLGDGPGRGRSGTQYGRVGMVIEYTTPRDEIEQFATRAAKAMRQMDLLGLALAVFGRPNRDAANYYLVYEYALRQFGGKKQAPERLGIASDHKAFADSTSKLSGSAGGRKPGQDDPETWDLVRQRDYAARLLRSWINVGVGLPPEDS